MIDASYVQLILDVEYDKGSLINQQLVESGCDFVVYIWLVTDVQCREHQYPIPAGLSEAMTKRMQGL